VSIGVDDRFAGNGALGVVFRLKEHGYANHQVLSVLAVYTAAVKVEWVVVF